MDKRRLMRQLMHPTLATAKTLPLRLQRDDGGELERDAAKELLERSLAGQHVELHVRALATFEPEKPMPLPASMAALCDTKFSRFSPVGFRAFARSFADKPFLRDHEQRSVLARAGRIAESHAIDVEGGVAIEQVLHVVKPWAVQGFLDGTLTQFSIGWRPKDPSFEGMISAVRCSVCRHPLLSLDCGHMPSERVVLTKGAEPVIVEAVWDSRLVEGSETSTVVMPAASGTGIEAITALSRAKESTMDELRQLLGLGEDATAEEIHAAVAGTLAAARAAGEVPPKLAAAEKKLADVEARLALERTAHEATRSQLAAAAIRLSKLDAERLDALVARGYREGRILPVEGGAPVERAVRDIAGQQGYDAAAAYLSQLPPVAQIGQWLQSGGGAAPARAAEPKLTPQQQRMARSFGLTDQEFLQYGGEPARE